MVRLYTHPSLPRLDAKRGQYWSLNQLILGSLVIFATIYMQLRTSVSFLVILYAMGSFSYGTRGAIV